MRKYLKSLPEDLSSCVTTLADELKVVPGKDILEQKLIDAFAYTFDVKFLNYSHCEEGEARRSNPVNEIASALRASQ